MYERLASLVNGFSECFTYALHINNFIFSCFNHSLFLSHSHPQLHQMANMNMTVISGLVQ